LSTTLIRTSLVYRHDFTLFCGYHNEKNREKVMYQFERSLSLQEDLVVRKHGLRGGEF